MADDYEQRKATYAAAMAEWRNNYNRALSYGGGGPAVQAVAALHTPATDAAAPWRGEVVCAHCSDGDGPADWPCDTVFVMAAALDVPIPLLIEDPDA